MPHKPHSLLPYGLLLLIPAVLLAVDPTAYRSFNAPKQHVLIAGTLSVALIGLTASWYRNRSLTFWWNGLEFLLLIRLGWLFLTNPSWGVHPSNNGFWLLLSLTLFAIMVGRNQSCCHQNHSSLSKRFIPALTCTLAIVGFIGLLQHISFFGLPIPSNLKTPVIGTIGAANGFGLLMSMGMLCSAWYLITVSNRLFQILSGVLFFFFAVMLLFNGSRGAMLSLVVTVMITGYIWLLYGSFDSNLSLLWMCVRSFVLDHRYLVATGLVVVFLVSGGLLYQLDVESSRGRLMVWELSLPMIVDHPYTGLGQGRYSVEYLNYQARYFENPEHAYLKWKAANLKQAHNEYLQAFCESGILGGILFLMIWIVTVWRFGKAATSEKYYRKFASGHIFLGAILVLILVHSFVDSQLHVLPVSLIAYILVGLTPVTRKKICTVSGWKLIVVVVPVMSLCFWGIFQVFTQYPGYWKWQKGVEMAEKQQWTTAINYYQSALEYLPQKGELQFHLGSALVISDASNKGLYYLDKAQANFNDRNIYLAKSLAFLKLGNLEKAEEQARRALAMFPDHLAPQLMLARINHSNGNDKLARQYLKACINQQTTIRSDLTRQIAADARHYWQKWYGMKFSSPNIH